MPPQQNVPELTEVWGWLAERAETRPYEDDDWNDYAEKVAAPYLHWLAKVAPLEMASGEVLGSLIGDIIMTTDGTGASMRPLIGIVAAIEFDMGFKGKQLGTSRLAKRLAKVTDAVKRFPPAPPPKTPARFKQMTLHLVPSSGMNADPDLSEGPPVWRDKPQGSDDDDDLDKHLEVS